MNEEGVVYRNEMRKVLTDLMLRIKKLEDSPKKDQIPSLMDKIHRDAKRLAVISSYLGGQVLSDYEVFRADLEHYLNVPDDELAYSQVSDDAAILLNELT